MNTIPIYIPIIKGKVNDFKALNNLSESALAKIKPLIETIPISPDKDIDEHMHKFVHNLTKHVPSTGIFVDFYGLRPGDSFENGQSALIEGYKLLYKQSRPVTPVYGFHRDDSIWSELQHIVRKFNQGFCFRIDIDDLDDQADETSSQIIERSAELGLALSQIDLIIDLRDIGDKNINNLQNIVMDFLSYKPLITSCRSICLSGSSALKTVSNISKDGVGKILRNELKLWMRLQSDLAGTTNLIYSDYGVFHPDFADIGSSKNANAKIRYTEGGMIFYFRGHKLFKPKDFEQYHILANRVKNSSIYQGPNFSYGDRYIYDVAEYNIGTGSLPTWVLADMNHHMEYSAQQIEKLAVEVTKIPSQNEIDEFFEVT